MNIDSYTRTAETHLNTGVPNQDAYAMRVHSSGCITLAVSDGCSSMPDSHYTSLDLSRKAVSCETLDDLISLNLKECRLGSNGHATLVWCSITNDITTLVMMGDGTWGISDSDGVHGVSLDWNDIPPYPTYEDELLRNWPGYSSLSSVGNIPEYEQIGTVFIWRFPSNWYQLWISSDGMLKHFNLSEVVNEISSLKNRSGQFLKRRMARCLKSISPMDDITVVSIVNKASYDECMG